MHHSIKSPVKTELLNSNTDVKNQHDNNNKWGNIIKKQWVRGSELNFYIAVLLSRHMMLAPSTYT